MKISEITNERLEMLGELAKHDAKMFACLIGLAAHESEKQCQRVRTVLGITKEQQATMFLSALANTVGWEQTASLVVEDTPKEDITMNGKPQNESVNDRQKPEDTRENITPAPDKTDRNKGDQQNDDDKSRNH